MPIHIGTSTKNQQQISIGGVQMQKVYVGDKLVWSKPSAFYPVNYGALYNLFAAIDSRNICSNDWRVPSLTDYNLLFTYLGGNSVAGGKLKEIGLVYWSTNTGATNYSLFNARGSGVRSRYGDFGSFRTHCTLWTTTVFATTPPQYRKISILGSLISVSDSLVQRQEGNSIRLIKNYTSLTNGQSGTYTGNDGKIYRTICIGTQEWLADNLAETKFRDGSYIPGFDGGTYTPFTNAAWAALTTSGMCVYGDDLANM